MMRGRTAGRPDGPTLVAALLLTVLPSGRLTAQCPDGTPPPCRGERAAAPSPVSVAVLYFENQSRDSGDAYLADGVTEEIINRLSSIERLRVRSQYAVRRYRGSALEDPTSVGRTLSVTYLVSGTIRRSGGRLRVSAELMRASGGAQVWGKQFEQPGDDILAIQEAVAAEVAQGIIGRLLPAERQVIASRPTRNAAAYDAYLLGRFYWGKRTAADLVRAAGYFEQAIRADSNFAQAWSGLADCYVLFLPAEYNIPGINPDSILTLAERSARRALALAPSLGDAYTSLGEILEYRSKWVEARAAFERGIALNPQYPTAHLWYGYDLEVWNRWSDAVREFERARDLDPASVVIVISLAAAYDGAGRPDDAMAAYDHARALGPDHPLVYSIAVYRDLIRDDWPRLASDMKRLWLLDGMDSSAASDIERRLLDPARRDAALRETAARPYERASWSALLRLKLDGEQAIADYLTSLPSDPKMSDVGGLLICGCLRPDLMTRLRPVFARFGFPEVR